MTLHATPRPLGDGEPDISLVDEDLYCVLGPGSTLGFVQKIGNMFVALSGSERMHAVEVGQSLSWDECVAMVDRAAHARH